MSNFSAEATLTISGKSKTSQGQLSREVTAGATSVTAVTPKYLDITYLNPIPTNSDPTSQRSHRNFSHGYISGQVQ